MLCRWILKTKSELAADLARLVRTAEDATAERHLLYERAKAETHTSARKLVACTTSGAAKHRSIHLNICCLSFIDPTLA